jgi:predicted nucleic acid-binding protein
MIVLDANVLIALIDSSDAHHASATALVDEHEWQEFAVSSLTLAEVLVHPARAGALERVASAIRDIGVHALPLTASDVPLLAELRSRHSVKMPDAVVLHAAITSGALLATFDARLRAASVDAGVGLAELVST